MRTLHVSAVVLLSLATACASPGSVASSPNDPSTFGKRVESRRGVIVTSATDASAAGIAMLEQGGNAIDAAVAASFALGVVDPSQTGLGGYAVGVAWMARDHRAEVMEAMGQVGADPAWGQPDPPRTGIVLSGQAATNEGGDGRDPRAAIVPGFVAGLLEWQAVRGKLTRAQVLAPAIRLAREGFIVGPLNHRLFTASIPKLKVDSEAAALFMPGGQVLKVGDRLVQTRLAGLLEAIARDGPSAFYAGDVPRVIAAKSRSVGGLLDAADFAVYKPAMRRPSCSTFLGYTVLGGPSPVSGPSISEVLHLAELSGLTSMGNPTTNASAAVKMADAIRVSLVDRRIVGGHPEWAPAPVRGFTSAAFAETRVGAVNGGYRDTLPRGDAWKFENETLPAACVAVDPYPATQRVSRTDGPGDDAAEMNGSQTSHMVVVDADHNAVSLTSSVGELFGSGVYANGIFLNSSGGLFARGERKPLRKPGSSIAPTLLLEGNEVRFGAGAGGAAYIPTAVPQAILRMAAWKQDPFAALAAPRLHPSANGPAMEIEQGFALSVYGALRAHGYVPTNKVANLQFAGVAAFWVRPDGVIVGAADPRRDGIAMGVR
ncbi:MAG: ggt [Gemmatimonadetes bacterium]|nr:ggt [Gemmatimonadota bacterium]